LCFLRFLAVMGLSKGDWALVCEGVRPLHERFDVFRIWSQVCTNLRLTYICGNSIYFYYLMAKLEFWEGKLLYENARRVYRF
jgi:hypothetical protein